MTERTSDLVWSKPYRLWSDDSDSVFRAAEVKGKGLYLFAVERPEGYLVYYVGMVGRRTFADRFVEHIKEYLCGVYRTYEPEEFARGEKNLVKGTGLWRDEDRRQYHQFVEDYDARHPKIIGFLRLLRVFLAETGQLSENEVETIEAYISEALKKAPDPVGSFQDNDIRYRKRINGDGSWIIKMTTPCRIIGLPEVLRI